MSLNNHAAITDTASPLVSVIMAVNRDDGFLHAAIDSVLTQSLKNIELLVIANNCTDELWKQLQLLADRDFRVRPFRTPFGQLPYNLNMGMQHARGEFVARMDADDLALSNRLELQVRFLQTNTEISVVGGSYLHIDEHGRVIGRPVALKLEPRKIHAHMPFESCMPHPTVMMRRVDAIRVGGYAYGLYAEDWDLWLRMRRAGMRFANLSNIVLHYRIHTGQSTSLQSMRRNMANVQALLLRELILTGNPKFAVSMLRHLGVECLRLIYAQVRHTFPKQVAAE